MATAPVPTDWQYHLVGPQNDVYFNTGGEPDDLGCVYVMPEPAGWDSPAMRLTPSDIPYTDGSNIPDGYLGSRTIHGIGTIQAPSNAALAAGRARLSQATRALRDDGQFIERPVDGSPLRYCTVRRLGSTQFPTRYPTGGQGLEAIAFDFQMVAGAPLKYDLVGKSVPVSSSTVAGGLTFPATFPITFTPDQDVLTPTQTSTNDGDFDTGYQAAFNGDLHNPVLVDRTSGGIIALRADVPPDRTVIVDTVEQTVTIDGEPIWSWLDTVRSTPLSQLRIPANGACHWVLRGQGNGNCVVTSKDARE